MEHKYDHKYDSCILTPNPWPTGEPMLTIPVSAKMGKIITGEVDILWALVVKSYKNGALIAKILKADAAGQDYVGEESNDNRVGLIGGNKMGDNINHPNHYTAGKVECIDALEAATEGLTGIKAVCTGNAIKYLWRWSRKGGVEDLKKANFYINHLIKILEKE